MTKQVMGHYTKRIPMPYSFDEKMIVCTAAYCQGDLKTSNNATWKSFIGFWNIGTSTRVVAWSYSCHYARLFGENSRNLLRVLCWTFFFGCFSLLTYISVAIIWVGLLWFYHSLILSNIFSPRNILNFLTFSVSIPHEEKKLS